MEVNVQGLFRTKMLKAAIGIQLQFLICRVHMDITEHHRRVRTAHLYLQFQRDGEVSQHGSKGP